jgi:hypothetical protein
MTKEKKENGDLLSFKMAGRMSFVGRKIWIRGNRLFPRKAVAGEEAQAEFKDVSGSCDSGEKVCRVAQDQTPECFNNHRLKPRGDIGKLSQKEVSRIRNASCKLNTPSSSQSVSYT